MFKDHQKQPHKQNNHINLEFLYFNETIQQCLQKMGIK